MKNSMNELYHHGILGQRWGKRNGPPYPLKESDHSASEKKAGWKKSLNDDPTVVEKKHAYKEAKREYSKAYNDWYNKSITGISPFKSHRKANDARYKLQMQKADEYMAAKKEYKDAKKLARETANKYRNRKLKDPDDVSTKGSRRLQDLFGMSDAEAARAKVVAGVLGVSLGTIAGAYIVGNVLSNKNIAASEFDLTEYVNELKAKVNSGEQTLSGINSDRQHSTRPFDLTKEFLENRSNDDYVGWAAKRHGYGEIDSNFLKKAINDSDKFGVADRNFDHLVHEVRVNQISGDSTRRLSCWSASHAYYLSALTGKDFVSKSFTNLLDFKELGKLYKEPPQIFDAFGKKAKDYVGKWGRTGTKSDLSTEKALIDSIFKNVSSKNNLTPDGLRTIGFITGGYRGMTCTHEWNFEILHLLDGTKSLVMADGWSGDRYAVATLGQKGAIKLLPESAKFLEELRHYNQESIRFYAPSLDSINPDTLAKVVLGKK